MSLPPEVMALLGDDATPERAIASFTAHRDESHPCADVDADEALAVYHAALAAAAIRECEAVRNHADAKHACDLALLDAAPEEMSTLAAERDAAAKEEREATAQYDALRHWRNRR